MEDLNPQNNQKEQENHYYPFGMKMEKMQFEMINPTPPENKYLYNGKVFVDDFGLDWYEYGFRMYDPTIGRFPSLDPKADEFAFVSPYNYAENRPIDGIDLWGLQYRCYLESYVQQQMEKGGNWVANGGSVGKSLEKADDFVRTRGGTTSPVKETKLSGYRLTSGAYDFGDNESRQAATPVESMNVDEVFPLLNGQTNLGSKNKTIIGLVSAIGNVAKGVFSLLDDQGVIDLSGKPESTSADKSNDNVNSDSIIIKVTKWEQNAVNPNSWSGQPLEMKVNVDDTARIIENYKLKK